VAAAGGVIEVPTVAGAAKMRIPAGLKSGMVLRLKGKGMPSLRGGGRGDLLVQVVVEVPKNLNKKQKDLLKDFEASLTEKNYAKRQNFFDKLKDKLNF
jgi:molecular chaperone DnaJ